MQGPDTGRGGGDGRLDDEPLEDGAGHVGTGSGFGRRNRFAFGGGATVAGAEDFGRRDSVVRHAEPGPFSGHEEVEEPLPLSEEGDRLPWLEADEEEDDDGVDTGRILAFVFIALLLLVLVLGTVWFLSRSGPEPEVVPDGSLIEAPEEPYKTRPEDPGGREVEGTGDQAFAVAEGETTEARIDDQAPRPSIDRDQDDGGAQDTGQSGASGVPVQVGAFSTRDAARNAWVTLRGRHAGLQGMDYRIVEGRADSGTIYRLQAMSATADAAGALCRGIKAEGGDCQVKR